MEFIKGMKVKVIGNRTGSFNIKIGEILEVVSVNNHNRMVVIRKNQQNYNIYFEDVKIFLEKEGLLKRIDDLKNKLFDIDTKLQFMSERNMEFFEDKEFQAYKIIKKYETIKDLSESEKLNEITKML